MDIALYPMLVQFLVRFFLLSILAVAWIQLGKAIDQKDRGTGAWLLLITSCQFHMPFYASRMLPNTFSLAIVLHSFAAWIRDEVQIAATLLVVGAVVFRCDLLLLLGCVGLAWLITKKLSILKALQIGVVTGVSSLAVTVPFDSLLWHRILWPEGEVLYYNAVLGKSSDWGTSPWHWYFLSALPKSMLLTLLLVPLSSLRIVEYLISLERWLQHRSSSVLPLKQLLDVEWLEYILPTLGFVSMYSYLGHKEMRFIFPAIPMLNVAAAAGMARLTKLAFPLKHKKPHWIAKLAFSCGVFCITATFAGSLIFVAVSCRNYPGGDALVELSKHIKERSPSAGMKSLNVHIDVSTAMSGVSLFGQRAANLTVPGVEWFFHKSGYEKEYSLEMADFEKFTHLLSETADISPFFRVIHTMEGNPVFNPRRLSIDTSAAIYILERENWDKDDAEES